MKTYSITLDIAKKNVVMTFEAKNMREALEFAEAMKRDSRYVIRIKDINEHD